ncbi:MAG: hypothetical protein ABI295_06200 [Xanthomarina sp.]
MKKPTKHLFAVLLLSTICFTSCKSEKELTFENPAETRDMIVQAKLEKNIKGKLQYPESYKLVELKLRDSVLYIDNINYYKNYYQQILMTDKSNLEKQELFKKQGSSEYKEKALNELKTSISKNEKILVEIDRITTELGDKANLAASYTYNYMFKSKNVSGNDADYNYIVQTNHSPEYKLISIAEREDMIVSSPNDFPGYKEMINTFK